MLQIYASTAYGTRVPTVRAYYYKRNNLGEDSNEELVNTEPPAILHTSVNLEDQNVTVGARFSDGDGSVPLLSLGYICTDSWQRNDSCLNPSGVQTFLLVNIYINPSFQWTI